MAEIPLSNWQTEGLRLSVFMRDPIEFANVAHWEPLLGQPPVERVVRPSQQIQKEEGPFLDGWLSVETTINRIDWRVSPNPRSAPQSLPVIGAYDEWETSFSQLMRRWIATSPATHRLAYGAVLLLPRTTMSEAYSTLSELLPTVDIDPHNTFDFQYRINRRRPSKILSGRLQINRLSTWSAGEIARIDVDLSSGKTPRIRNVVDGTVCRLELDINTAPEYGEVIDKDRVASILDELIKLGGELASRGDIP